MPYPYFDRKRLRLLPLSDREHTMQKEEILSLDSEIPPASGPELVEVAKAISKAREQNRAVVMLMGAHVIKQGLSRFVIEMLRRGILTHLGTNGAGAIHDYEMALIGATTESVAKYIQEGQFGLWQETGGLNDVARTAFEEGIGFGEQLGKTISEGDFPHKDVSIFATAYEAGVPCSIHVSIGQDIVHEYPNFDGSAVGWASYRDFLVFAKSLEDLEGGVYLNYGTSVMGPEVYLKALSMVRNVSHRLGRQVRDFTTAVFDLIELPADTTAEPPKTHAAYYYRPLKTVLIRTVRDGGRSFYVRADHRLSLPNLYRLLTEQEPDQ